MRSLTPIAVGLLLAAALAACFIDPLPPTNPYGDAGSDLDPLTVGDGGQEAGQ
jgi:hypothetical protein